MLWQCRELQGFEAGSLTQGNSHFSPIVIKRPYR